MGTETKKSNPESRAGDSLANFAATVSGIALVNLDED